MPESIPTSLVASVVGPMAAVIVYQNWQIRSKDAEVVGLLERCLTGLQTLATAVEKVADRVRP